MKGKKISAALLAILAVFSLSGIVHAAATGVPYASSTLLNQDPDPAEPGKYVEIRWKVTSQGNGVIENLTYRLDLAYPFYFDASDTPYKYVGNLQGSTSKDEFYTLYYKIRVSDGVPEGTYKVKLYQSTANSDIWVETDYDIRVGEKKSSDFTLGQLVTSPTKLARDTDSAKIAVEIVNIGKLNADNAVVQAQFPEGFTPSYTYSDRAALGTIGAGMSKTATFYVDISKDAAGGTRYANLTITYKESGTSELKTEKLDLELPLQEKPLFDIVSQATSPVKIYADQAADLRLSIKNIGGEDADSVSVRVFKDSSQPLELTESSDFIGKLKAGETGDAVLKLKFDKDAEPKSYRLDVEIRSVSNNDVLVQRKTISVELADNSANSVTGNLLAGVSSALLALFALVVAAVGFVAYRVGKGSESRK